MAGWPLKHDGPCGCRFVRREEFCETEQTEWCGLHTRQRDEMKRMRTELALAVPAMREYANKNPVHNFCDTPQDPQGVHAWLARNEVPNGTKLSEGER